MYSPRNFTQYTHLTNLLSCHTLPNLSFFFRSPFSISNPHKKANIPSNPAKSPPLTISLLFFPSLEPGSSVGPVLLVGVGPVLVTTVVPYTIISSLPLKTSPYPFSSFSLTVIVVVPPPGNCAVKLGFLVHVNGPLPPDQVVFCPEHVQVGGHVVSVVIPVTVVVTVVLL